MLVNMDCRTGLRSLPSASIDSMVTDPPYGLSKQPDIVEVLTHWLAGDDYKHNSKGFMGKGWDSFVPGPKTWEEAIRVLKPGAVAAVFSGSRTLDLMSISLRIAGFEVFDIAHWMYGSGFPKSMNIKKALEAKKNRDSDMWEVHHGSYDLEKWDGWGTALKPCHEPIILCRKPLDGTYANNILKHGVGALNIDKCRIEGRERTDYGLSTAKRGPSVATGSPSEHANFDSTKGRWPTNILHDGCLPEPMDRYFYCAKATKEDREKGLDSFKKVSTASIGGRAEESKGHNNPRAGVRGFDRANSHPTVKPTELMRWLCRLVTPAGGTLVDPFIGSGSTAKGGALEGFNVVGFETEPEYHAIAKARHEEAKCKARQS